jgi:hypothetical protein
MIANSIRLIAVLSFLIAIFFKVAAYAAPVRFCMDLSPQPAEWQLKAHELSVLSLDATFPKEVVHELRHTCLARVPMLEVAAASALAEKAAQLGIPSHCAADTRRLEVLHPAWPALMVTEGMETAVERGFSGVLFSQLELAQGGLERAAIWKALAFVRARYPEQKVFLECVNAADVVADSHPGCLDGVVWQVPAVTDHVIQQVQQWRAQKLAVFVAISSSGTADPGEQIRQTRSLEAAGVSCCLTAPGAKGTVLAPLRQQLRRVLVVHDGAEPAQRTVFANHWHGALQWLGFSPGYQTQEQIQALSPETLTAHYAGVIMDPACKTGFPAVLKALPQLDLRQQKKQSAGSPVATLESWITENLAAVGPVVDVSRLEGRPVLAIHISPEGFAEPTQLRGMPLAGEVMHEQVLSQVKLPVTMAYTEALLRAWQPQQRMSSAARLLNAAQALSALPFVETASAGMTGPRDWSAGSFSPGPLAAAAEQTGLSMQREIAGSLTFLHHQVSGPRIFSWSYGVPASDEAVAFSQRMGVENVALLPKTLPEYAAENLQPQSWGHGTSLQTFLPDLRDTQAKLPLAQLQKNWSARLQSPEHLRSPLLLSLNHHQVQTPEDCQQLLSCLNWLQKQALRPVTVANYAAMVRDAQNSQIFRLQEPGQWLILNQTGAARTLRVPVSAGWPDLAACRGIAGYTQQGAHLYIHTMGHCRTLLALKPHPAATNHLRLTSAQGNLRYLMASADEAMIKVLNPQNTQLHFAGLTPGVSCQVMTNKTRQILKANAAGELNVQTPPQALVHMKVLPDGLQAAMR